MEDKRISTIGEYTLDIMLNNPYFSDKQKKAIDFYKLYYRLQRLAIGVTKDIINKRGFSIYDIFQYDFTMMRKKLVNEGIITEEEGNTRILELVESFENNEIMKGKIGF